MKIKWRLQKVSLHCTTLLCRKNLHMPKLRVVWGRGIWTRCFWNPSIAKCAHKSISPFCLMYHWSHQCSLCWSEARQHCHHSNIASHNWDCLGCRARWWPMMGSPQGNLWKIHFISPLCISEVTYEGIPQGALWKKLSRQVHKVYNHCNRQKTKFCPHHMELHIT